MKNNKIIMRLVGFVVCLSLIFTCGCSSGSNTIEKSANNEEYTSKNNTSKNDSLLSKAFKPKSRNTNKNDMGLGLKNIKIDTTERELTEEQKSIITYFDNDYLMASSYEFLRRYPNIFEGAQLELDGIVAKIISMDNENYKLLLSMNVDMYYATGGGEYVILYGKTKPSPWLVEEDYILVDGRYTGVETVEVDGTSYTVPAVQAYNTYYKYSRTQVLRAEKFDYSLIKVVAESIFGKDIDIREPVAGEDISMDDAMLDMYYCFGGSPYAGMPPSEITEYADFVVELEDQSNANFKKFRFSKFEGEIIDAKGPFDAGIERKIEFSADFEHFFLFTHNSDLESLKLSYYDKSYNKIWERDFDEITNAVYDYTETNLYIVVNNEFYIINIATGEDVFPPSYVGEKREIRKDNDGIVIVSANKSDGVMKLSNSGEIVWKANLSANPESVYGIQFVNDNIIIYYSDEDWNDYYCLVDNNTGKIITETIGELY